MGKDGSKKSKKEGRFKKSTNNILEMIVNLIPFFLLAIMFSITKSELGVTIGAIIIIAIYFKIRYYKNEWKLLILGILVGFFVEVVGDMIYQLQFWSNASLFTIPLWLPLYWGIVFVAIRRIGNIMVK